MLFVACSSAPGEVVTVTAEQACSDYAAAVCDELNKCAPLLVSLSFNDVATCKTRVIINCPKIFEANGTSATPAKLEQCKLDASNLACNDLFANAVPPACVPSPGTLVDGNACGDDAQCVSTFCSRKSDAVCGVCAKLPSAGAPCTGSSFLGGGDCGRGLVCANKVCVKPKLKDETGCDSTTAPCLAGLSCFGGKCVTAAKGGEACDGAEKTGPNCDLTQGFYCAGLVSKSCKSAKVVAAGQPCGFISGEVVACGGGSTCKNVTGTAGTCMAPAADGGACDPVKGPDCLGPAKCVANQCKIADPTTCK